MHGIELIEVRSEGPLAVATGKWSANGLGDEGAAKRYEGTVVHVLRRAGGDSWKPSLHIWN